MTKTYDLLTEKDLDKIDSLIGRKVSTTCGYDYLNISCEHYLFKGIERPSKQSPFLIRLEQLGKVIFVGLEWLSLLEKT